jgi:protein SCO1/2
MVFARLLIAIFVLCATTGGFVSQANMTQLGGDFVLVDQDGQPFALQQLRGKVVLLFFGYTYCPDICPTELSNIASVLSAPDLEPDAVQGLFITLDAARDKPDVLKSYIEFFNSDLIGLGGSQTAIDRVAAMYGVKFQRQVTDDQRYSIDHSANLYIIDRDGRLAAVVPYGLPPEHVLGVVKDLLKSGE